MMMKDNCDFCVGVESWRLVNEDQHMRSFLSIQRLAKGHTLVTPKLHAEPPVHLSPQERDAILFEIERLQGAMIGRLAAGVDTWQKTRPEVAEGSNGTKMNHLHTHVIPSQPGDEVYDKGLIWTPDRFVPLTKEEAEEVLPILRKGL